MKVHNQSGKD